MKVQTFESQRFEVKYGNRSVITELSPSCLSVFIASASMECTYDLLHANALFIPTHINGDSLAYVMRATSVMILLGSELPS